MTPRKRRRTKAERSAAARKGWATRRANERRRAAERAVRAERARRAWRIKRGDVDGILLNVYDIDDVDPLHPLGRAQSFAEAEAVAETARFPDVVEDVTLGDAPPRVSPRKAYYVRFGAGLDEPLDDIPSDEWEIGFEYHSGAGGKSSHVDVNIRIARDDGAVFGAREAHAVLARFRRNLSLDNANPIPRGYRMAFIDWRRPRWGTSWQSGDEGDISAFHAPMYSEQDNDSAWHITQSGNTRLGSVKR